LKESRCN